MAQCDKAGGSNARGRLILVENNTSLGGNCPVKLDRCRHKLQYMQLKRLSMQSNKSSHPTPSPTDFEITIPPSSDEGLLAKSSLSEVCKRKKNKFTYIRCWGRDLKHRAFGSSVQNNGQAPTSCHHLSGNKWDLDPVPALHIPQSKLRNNPRLFSDLCWKGYVQKVLS